MLGENNLISKTRRWELLTTRLPSELPPAGRPSWKPLLGLHAYTTPCGVPAPGMGWGASAPGMAPGVGWGCLSPRDGPWRGLGGPQPWGRSLAWAVGPQPGGRSLVWVGGASARGDGIWRARCWHKEPEVGAQVTGEGPSC